MNLDTLSLDILGYFFQIHAAFYCNPGLDLDKPVLLSELQASPQCVKTCENPCRAALKPSSYGFLATFVQYLWRLWRCSQPEGTWADLKCVCGAKGVPTSGADNQRV